MNIQDITKIFKLSVSGEYPNKFTILINLMFDKLFLHLHNLIFSLLGRVNKLYASEYCKYKCANVFSCVTFRIANAQTTRNCISSESGLAIAFEPCASAAETHDLWGWHSCAAAVVGKSRRIEQFRDG